VRWREGSGCGPIIPEPAHAIAADKASRRDPGIAAALRDRAYTCKEHGEVAIGIRGLTLRRAPTPLPRARARVYGARTVWA